MTFTEKTIHSNLLGKDFKALCWEMQKKGRVETVVAHEAFEDIIFNGDMPDGFSYDVAPITSVASYPVMQCTMADATGRKIFAIGEAHPNTLVNAISKNNPVIMASNRAFDRAAIRYLDFEGKFYSSAEIPDDKDADVSDNYDENNDVDHGHEGHVATGPAVVEAEPEDEPPSEYHGTFVIKMGKYKDAGKTVAQIWNEDENWAKYMANLPVNNDASNNAKTQYKALKKYGEYLGKL